MVYAILSDIHANEQALWQVLSDATHHGAEKFVCLGDIVGYGPQPEESIALVRRHCEVVLAGNHDDAVCGRMDKTDFNARAAEAVLRHRKILSEESLRWLASLPYVYEGEHFVAAHGDFTDPKKFYYVDRERDVAASFERVDSPLLFVGHTHEPRIGVVGSSGKAYLTNAQDFTMEKGKRYLVNPGSVGYPREKGGLCRSSYVLFDSEHQTVVFRFLPFSIDSVMPQPAASVPRRSSKRIWWTAGVALLAVLVLGVGLHLSRHQEKVPIVANAPENAPEKGPLQSVVLKISPKQTALVPNVILKKGSCPVMLKMMFLSADGVPLDERKEIVRQAFPRRKFKIPAKTATAKVSLWILTPGESPEIDSFEPHAQE